MKSLKILTFLRYPPWDKRAAGGQFSAWSTIKWLAKKGHCLKVVIGDTSEPLPCVDNIEFYKTKPYKINRTNITWFMESLKFKNIDLVYGFDPENFLTNLYCKKVRKVPIVHEVKSPRVSPLPLRNIYKVSSIESLKWHLYFSFDSFACRYSDVIFVPSNYSKNMIKKEYKLEPSKIFAIPNGVERDILRKHDENFERNNVKLIFIGKLVAQKGVDILIKSIKEVVKKGYNVTLMIVGNGDLEEEYKKMVLKFGLESNVKFLGFVSGDGKFELLKTSDIFVFPSNHESFGNVLIEAMASSLPVITTNVTAIPEVVDTDTGILILPNNAKALAEAIIYLIKNPDEMRRMGLAGYEKVKKYFIWDTIIDKKIDILKKILDN